FARHGHITAANGGAAIRMLEADIDWLATVNDRAPRMLTRAETAELCGTDCYIGGYLDPRAAGIHPLDYVRGLANGLAESGVPVYTNTSVIGISEDASGVALST